MNSRNNSCYRFSKRKAPLIVKIFFLLGFLCFQGFPLLSFGAEDTSEHNRLLYPQYSKKVSMEFKNAELNDVLRIFSNQSGLNFIAAQEAANKKVTLFLKDVPVEEALERILSANDLIYDIQPGSDIFVVKPLVKVNKEVVTRVYPLKYATVSSSKLNSTLTISPGSGLSSSTEGAASEGSSGGSSSGSSSNASLGGSSAGIIEALKSILSPLGKIVEDPRTNSLIVTDIASHFAMIERTLARLDVPVPQILIEIEMLDISKNTSDKLGVKFGETPLNISGAQRSILYPWDRNSILDKIGYVFDPTDEEKSEYKVGSIDASGFSMLLQFLKTQTDTRNLARPRILTLNNQIAEIKIATNEAIGQKTTTSTSDTSASRTVEAERTSTGVFLSVTPQANLLTGEITMAIYPKVIQARPGATFSGVTFKDPEERGTQSLLKVYSGDTVIVGGLLRTDSNNTITKVPILGDLPVIGGAFRHKDQAEVERELIIFLTPHILSDSSLSATHRTSQKKNIKINREQDIPTPSRRSQEIDRALTSIE